MTKKEKDNILSYISLDSEVNIKNNGNHPQKLYEIIEDVNAVLPGDGVSNEDMYSELSNQIKTLTEKEQFIINSRFGLNGPQKKLREIAEELNSSIENIFVIEKRALKKLKFRVNES